MSVTENFRKLGGYSKRSLELRLGTLQSAAGVTTTPEAGWGVIFDPEIAEEVRTLLLSLGKLRMNLSTLDVAREHPFLNLRCPDAKESAKSYLESFEQQPGAPIDPSKFPYYVVIVAPPSRISYSFEIELGIQNAVGRLWLGNHFDRWKSYIGRLLMAGNPVPVQNELSCPISFCKPEGQDLNLNYAVEGLLEPLSTRFDGGSQGTMTAWKKTQDLQNLSLERSSLSFICAHGAESRFTQNEEQSVNNLRLRWQGLPVSSINAASIHSAEFDENRSDGPLAAPEDGGSWMFSCFSAGTTSLDPIAEAKARPSRQAPHDFNSEVSRISLSKCRFYLGSVNRVSAALFATQNYRTYVSHFQLLLTYLLKGYPVGWARETALSGLWVRHLFDLEKARRRQENEAVDFHFHVFNDLSNLVVAGDPAAFLGRSGLHLTKLDL
jgi:hypothetical protein